MEEDNEIRIIAELEENPFKNITFEKFKEIAKKVEEKYGEESSIRLIGNIRRNGYHRHNYFAMKTAAAHTKAGRK